MILYDHTDTLHSQMTTGIQRVVKQLGHALLKTVPNVVLPVIQWQSNFYHAPLESPPGYDHVATFHPFRAFIRRLGAGPLRTFKHWSNENRLLRELKTRLWQALDIRQLELQAPIVRPDVDDWYLTADAIWNWPPILDRLRYLKARGLRMAVVHYDLTPVTHPAWSDPILRGRFPPYADTLAAFDVVFCISEVVRQEFLKFCRTRGHPVPDKVVTIPMGYQITRNPIVTEPILPELEERPFVLCVGTLEPRKNHRSLLDAFDILWNRGLELSLVLVGRPGYASDEILSRTQNHLMAGHRLFYLPNCKDEELEYLYDRCAFTALPSFFEGFGLPVAESLSRGKPCACSDISTFREVARHFGVYFNPEDPGSIASAIESLYLDRQRLESLRGSICSEYFSTTWEDTARVILETLGYNPSAG